ncbi:MAG: hypothetical protein R3279_06095 [Putridiphycobacter sp.]|nr:hypothetical protein [Putridiphycobacter sp.]
MESFNNLKYQFGRFIGPAIAIIVGVYLYIQSVTPTVVSQFNPNGDPFLHEPYTQGPEFKIAALFFIVVGVIWILYILNVLKSFIGIAIGLITLGIAAWLLYLDYNIVKKDVDYIDKKEMVYKAIKNRLNDLKIAQTEYKSEYGHYTNDIDSLIDYIKNGKTIQYVRKGTLPTRKLTRAEADFIYGKRANKALDNNITDVEAKALLKMDPVPEDLRGIVRDTVYVPVLTSIFGESSYLEQRKKKGIAYDFHPDSLRLIPYTNNPVLLDTSSVLRGEIKVPTLLMRMPHPINPKDTLSIGDTLDNSLKDSWSLSNR